MNKTEYPNKTERLYDIKAAGSGAKTFVLWREVIMAYVSPAIMAGIGGLITADKGLQLAALTTIGGTSALIALMLGLWLRIRGGRKRWLVAAPHLVVVWLFALMGAMLGLCAAWATTNLLGIIIPIDNLVWIDRIWIDFPLSGVIASTIVTWRWRLAVKTNLSFQGRR
ncbi:hypothetical protein [Paenibacillus alginolyticus]|uniref:Uncharacterized protein n=1 Tax=Paenibacillus alginolyticus TaxID=59839 RepID=A0ABT4GAW3_9BACL|nr:hypothetical protein [Paenibacillus alginolyticus]MCY9693329.1 hypothetical protein [Paenibacillus alginolyticus]MEC0145103.1 hypothetical protein [Paenibacillus alginolyticus]